MPLSSQPTTAPPVDVLLIEDNAADARFFGLLLESSPAAGNFRLRHAATLAAGVAMLGARRPDVVVLDLGLGESEGLATVQHLVASGVRLPALVVLSGLDDEDVAVEALQAGAQDYLIKGQIDGRQLARAIRYAIGRHQAEHAIAERTAELERSRELVRSLGARNARLLEEERRRVARELHDEMGQQLAALRMEIAVLRQGRVAAAQASSDAALGMLLGRVDGLVVSVRRIVAELRPPALDGGLAAALDWLVSDFERQTQLDCEVDVDACASLLSADAAAMVFRIAQESLNNARRHAVASKVSLRLQRTDGGCELRVSDDGGGFDPSERTAGFGILGMEERARALGGSLDIDSRPGQGTEVRLRLPLSEARGVLPAARPDS
ncbi:MAG TPA: response regulator [Burkholderiaceae bacterium]